MYGDVRTTAIGKIVSREPRLARVFEKFDLDYCCRGRATLAEACRERNVAIDDVLVAIDSELKSPSVAETDWNAASLTELAEHIVATHHKYLREELPRIDGLIQKVFQAHGTKHAALAQLEATYRAMRAELESHMSKEENLLFPAIRMLETAPERCQFPFGSVANPIRMMRHEHDNAGAALRHLSGLTAGYTPPPDACPTYRAMLDSLARLEQDLHLHIHKENNILFPRAHDLELVACAG